MYAFISHDFSPRHEKFYHELFQVYPRLENGLFLDACETWISESIYDWLIRDEKI